MSSRLRLVLSCAVLLFVATGILGVRAEYAPWVPIGNELEVSRDARTGREVRYYTNGDYREFIFYPHALTWEKSGDYLFFESERPRPPGRGETVTGERQILAAKIDTGELYWVCTIPNARPQVTGPREFHVDYAPDGDLFVISEASTILSYVYDLKTGQTSQIYRVVPGASLGDPPSVARDGSRIALWCSEPGPYPADETYNSRVYKMYIFDRLPDGSYTEAQEIKSVIGLTSAVSNLSHAVLNPALSDVVMYYGQDGIYTLNTDGTNEQRAIPLTSSGWRGHQVWGWGGKYMHLVDTYRLARLDWQTGDYEVIDRPGDAYKVWHDSVSASGRQVAYETTGDTDWDEFGNASSRIIAYNWPTGLHTILCTTKRSVYHPRHPHPQISPDGMLTAFTESIGDNCRVAIVASHTSSTLDFLRLASPPPGTVLLNAGPFNDGTAATTYPDTTQARWLSTDTAAMLRGVALAFTWQSDYAVTGLGLRLARAQGKDLAVFDDDQPYAFDLHNVSSDTSVHARVVYASGIIETQDIAGGEFLYARFDSPVTLRSGDTYAAHLYPLAIDGNNRLFFDTEKDAVVDSYPEGRSFQTAGTTWPEDGVASAPATLQDLSFFATAHVPLEATAIVPETTGPTTAVSVDFEIDWTVPPYDFDGADIEIMHGGMIGGAASIVEQGTTTSTVRVSGLSGNGTFSLKVRLDSDVRDAYGAALLSSVESAEVAYEDTVAPSIPAGIVRLDPSPVASQAVRFGVDFSEPVALEASDITVLTDLAHGAVVAHVESGDGWHYTVTVEPLDRADAGSLALSLPATLSDVVGRVLGVEVTSETYVIEPAFPARVPRVWRNYR